MSMGVAPDTTGRPIDVLVLAYHAVSDTWPADTTVTAAELERQLAGLVERGYRGATLSCALSAPPAPRTLVVTFDDAHRSVLTRAAPVLRRLGLPGTVFVPTDYAGTGRPTGWSGFEEWLGTPHEAELVCLDWDELDGLAGEGWEIGSHTCSHPRLPRVGDEQLAVELRESRRTIEERLGRPCPALAYPYSDVDGRVVAAARDAGYAAAVTIPVRVVPPLPLQWPRVGVSRGDSDRRFRAFTSPLARRALASPAAGAALEGAREMRRRLLRRS